MAAVAAGFRRTPLYAAHRALGATMTEFAGWEMPLQYTGVVAEHMAVRRAVGLFDVSHMGVLLAAGPNAESVLNLLLTNDVARLHPGHAQYTLICNEHGGVVDDLVLYRIEPSVFMLVVNAANTQKDFDWIAAHADKPVVLQNVSAQTAGLALQGPRAPDVLPEAAALDRFAVGRFQIAGCACWVARTGYTGEDGFELFCSAGDAEKLWSALLERGSPFGIVPAGLGARDSLRLEMCYPLYGHELDEQTTPLEAGLSRFVAFDKGEFTGRSRLVAQRQ
ncbi:MAG: glycine cleavage system aminomethyltransferase GcvT, partial [Verrucomicrobiales bacterium]|nr:glycine cleavage system aminomethyltransferase GcvT [Verrucomicrobiales bacterium]